MGAEAIQAYMKDMDLDAEIAKLREELESTGSETRIKKIAKRLKLLEAFQTSGNRPEWMIMEVLPVLPPDLRAGSPRRWPFRDIGLERSVSSSHQP